MTDTQTFRIVHEQARSNALDAIHAVALDAQQEVIVRDVKEGKTRQQLGALFGLWATYVMEQTGYTKDEVHAMWKANFLCRIYCESPQGKQQDAWVDLLFHLQQRDDWEGVKKHSETISLSLASVKQMRQYMDEIQGYYISNGIPLPIPSQFVSVYK